MAALLPLIPRTVFRFIEPISLLAGFLGPIIDPEWFAVSQMPFTYSPTKYAVLSAVTAKDATVKLLAQQLGNTYLLLGLLGLFILNTTSELKVVNAYLWALWLGDIGHVGLTSYHMGIDGLLAWRQWNGVAWGNITFTIWLFAMRSLYFMGAFSTSATNFRSKGREVEAKTKAHVRKAE